MYLFITKRHNILFVGVTIWSVSFRRHFSARSFKAYFSDSIRVYRAAIELCKGEIQFTSIFYLSWFNNFDSFSFKRKSCLIPPQLNA